MRMARTLSYSWPAVIIFCAVSFGAAPASAFVACNSSGDCWQTSTKVKWPGVALMFHDDSWWDTHKGDQHFRMHDADERHDPKRGYWANGVWTGS